LKTLRKSVRFYQIWVFKLSDPIHIPVLKEEVVFFLNCKKGKFFVDGTVGCGGHAKAILEAKADTFLLGLDVDEEALKEAERVLVPYEGRYHLVEANFAKIGLVLKSLHQEKVDGILLDLGMSSLHLAQAKRGFSFLRTGPLDMRMSKKGSLTAELIVNRWSQARLKEIIQKYGEEKWAGRIAKCIVEERTKAPIQTTTQLAEIVAKAIPRRYWPHHIHPATRTFQALRIAVNNELENLKQFLTQALDCLTSGGRLVIISFHSLEDRMVKKTFREWARENKVRPLTKKPVVPTQEEVKQNPRARSAKLRAIEKI